MANVVKAAKQLKKKRIWFNVIAPEIYQNKELDEVLSAEPEKLINRNIEVNFSQITGSPKDQHKKLILQITDVKGETAQTRPTGYYMIDGFLQRAVKKYPEQFIHVFYAILKDGKKMKIKLSFGSRAKMYRGQKTEMMKIIEDLCKIELEKQSSVDVFALGYLPELELKMKKATRQVYPIDHIKIWKASLM